MNSGNQHFDKLVTAGNPIGEVIAVDRFLIQLTGLHPCNLHSLVLFEDGSKGYVHQLLADKVIVLHLGKTEVTVGMIAVVQYQELVCKIGKDYIGRVISVTGDPLDGKGPIAPDGIWPVFNDAPPIHARQLLTDQLESGIIAVDSFFPLVRGQRMALLGDSKSGKTALVTQLTINQKNTDQVVVYCMIAKRRSDIDELLSRLESSGGIAKAIVIVSLLSDSIILSYLAPYIACSMAEYLWQKCNQDTIIIYDDLTSHAYTYREIALSSNVSPGRDSYPGDMFYAHSSLLERAGRLKSNGKHLTCVPLVTAAGGDITAFLPTNIMSITDGQWILDMDTFRKGIRPAVNIGLSVTRAGGIGHSKRQKTLSAQTLKLFADFRQAEEYSHFGSELALESKRALVIGQQVQQLVTQSPTETFSLLAQQLMLDIILNVPAGSSLDISTLKLYAEDFATKITKDEDFENVRDELRAKSVVEIKGAIMPNTTVRTPKIEVKK